MQVQGNLNRSWPGKEGLVFNDRASIIFLPFFNSIADINLDISKPLKANLSFTKLDQINHFLKKIRSVHSKETSTPSDTVSNKDEFPASKCYRGKLSKSKVHGEGAQKIPFQENLWRTISCFQKVSVHTTQIVVSMETVPHPSKPCLLASLSTLRGSLNVRAAPKIPGKSQKGGEGGEGDDDMIC